MTLIELRGLTDAAGFRIGDDTPGNQAIGAVAAIGDINADGLGDVAIGLPGANGGKGAVYVLYGGAGPVAGPLSLATLGVTQGYRLDGVVAGGGLGAALSAAGDINGDGIADYLAGAPGADAAYVIHGRLGTNPDPINLAGSSGAAVRIFGFGGTGFGTAVAALDLNRDGLLDAVIGAPGTDGRKGAAYVVYGQAAGLAQTIRNNSLATPQISRLDGASAAGLAGSALATGDVDGDGSADLIIGAPNTGSGKGAVYVVHARSGGVAATFDLATLTATQGARVDGETAGDRLGSALTVADLDGDGIADIAIGASAAHGVAGAAQVVFGRAGGIGAIDLGSLAADQGFRLTGLADTIGGWTVGSGDLDGDGIADLVIGADGTGGGAGTAWVLYGRAGLGAVPHGGIDLTSLADDQGFQVDGTAGSGLGAAVAIGGADADGYAGLLLGAGKADAGGKVAALLYGAGQVTWTGGAAGDTRIGDRAGNLFAGLAGDDSLVGNAGPDTLLGGDGADTLDGGSGADLLDSGPDGDAGGDDLLSGGRGADTLVAGSGRDTLDGGPGADRLVGGAGVTVFIIDDPGDVLVAGTAPPAANLIRSTLTFTLPETAASLTLLGMEAIDGTGTDANADGITGNDAANRLSGLGGGDVLLGLGGADTLWGGAGGDILLGGDGGDLIDGGEGADSLDGGAGYDTILGGAGADTLRGGEGNDRLEGGGGADLAVLGVARTDATLHRQADGSWVVASAEGTDRLSGIERLQFADQTVALPAAPKDFTGAGCSSLLFREAGGTLVGAVLAGPTLLDTSFIASPGAAWKVAGTGDFNGDGMADILWRNDDGSVSVWHMQGTTFLGGGGLGNPGIDWTVAGVGDLNGDGMADILWRQDGGAVAAWLMDGTGAIGGGTISTVGTDWAVAGMGDFNGDGRADIVWRQAGTGHVALWMMDGTHCIGGGGVAKVGVDWQVAGIGDFNGDLMSDILWLRPGDGTLAEWWMNGTTGIGGGTVAKAGPGWRIADVGDYDGDGRSDVAWRETGGAMVLWTLDGTGVTATGDLGNPGTNWMLA